LIENSFFRSRIYNFGTTYKMATAFAGNNKIDNFANGVRDMTVMLERIAESDAAVKSQQIGEKDLSFREKVDFLKEMYNKNKRTFIYKFGKYLQLEDLILFQDSDNYELEFYVEKLRKSLDPCQRAVIVKNRRLNYLNTVLRKEGYFEEDELENRNPLLYKQYISQFATDEEKLAQNGKNLNRQTFSQFIFGTIDRDMREFRCKLETEMVEEMEEESDGDEDGEVDEDFEKYVNNEVAMTSEERKSLRNEFICLMEKRFIDGDEDFNYSKIDNDETFDDMIDQDLEDKYFDAD